MSVTAPEMPLDTAGQPRYRYVVIEGPAGAGKSALAKVLAERWAMSAVFEHPESNPFLERFYRDPARYALATQTHFLLERNALTAQLVLAAEAGAPSTAFPATATSTSAAIAAVGASVPFAPAPGPVVGDFLPQKDAIYARLNLDDEEFALYQRLAAQLTATAPAPRTPDLVIYLQASPETLFARIQKQANSVELQITDSYLRALCDAYNHFFYHYNDAPLLTVNADNLEPADNDADLGLLLDHIRAMRGPREVFVKGEL